mgnify:CR=1 FL=1
MESNQDGINWKDRAASYYRDGLKITDIAVLLDVSRQSVSSYIKTLPDLEDIKEKRRAAAAKTRRSYKTEKQRVYRAADCLMAVTPETMRREHELAAMELSREKYH